MPLIAEHEFNSAWWGQPTGIVRDPELFRMNKVDRESLLAAWPWIEHRELDASVPRIRELADCGFMHADMQIAFRIRLKGVAETASTQRLVATSAAEARIHIQAEALRPFLHERFYALPGADADRVARRYALWANALIADHPRTCLHITHEGRSQGWFLAKPADKGLNLTLAMLHQDATISGSLLYRKALARYASQGHRVGQASFGATNTAVLNIYSELGARFTGTVHNFLWVR